VKQAKTPQKIAIPMRVPFPSNFVKIDHLNTLKVRCCRIENLIVSCADVSRRDIKSSGLARGRRGRVFPRGANDTQRVQL